MQVWEILLLKVRTAYVKSKGLQHLLIINTKEGLTTVFICTKFHFATKMLSPRLLAPHLSLTVAPPWSLAEQRTQSRTDQI